MTKQLPKKLGKEPLIDVVFEIRFTCNPPAGGILPGFLFTRLNGHKTIIELPTMQLPQQIRNDDPNLKFAPLHRLNWNDQYWINIGDHSVSMSVQYPYSGWENFKNAVNEIMNIMTDAHLINSIDRYAMKYINLFTATSPREQTYLINFDVTLAGRKLEEDFQLRVEIPEKEFIHIVQVISSATAILHTGESRKGLIVDIDTISSEKEISFDELINELSDRLETIHLSNKKMFFDCLKPETIEALEPIYE